MSLHDRVILEYAGVGGRNVGARRGVQTVADLPNNSSVIPPKLAAKVKRLAATRQEVRARLREISLEDRRVLKTVKRSS